MADPFIAPNRRIFLQQSAAVAAVGTGLAVNTQAAMVHPEIEEWKREIGSRFRVENMSLILRSVSVKDRSADHARPRHLRPHSIEMLFVRESGQSSKDYPADFQLHHRFHKILLSRVVPPEGASGEFYEGIIN